MSDKNTMAKAMRKKTKKRNIEQKMQGTRLLGFSNCVIIIDAP